MKIGDRFEGCIIAGSIGDAWGSGFENQYETEDDTYYLDGNPFVQKPSWGITDDTQLTIATIEAIIEGPQIHPQSIANQFLKLFKQRKLRGVGASTLKALRELSVGGHWSQVGRRGEYAAGNGAAMRIAPIAFLNNVSKSKIRDICSITHNNDEAYVGALCVIIAIREILNQNWVGKSNLLELIIDQIPDTRIRDRLIKIKHIEDLEVIGSFGKNGYVVDSVPLALAAANKVDKIGIENMFLQLIQLGGDTDTNCSIAGQIAGTLVGINGIPKRLKYKIAELAEYEWIKQTILNFKQRKNWE